MASAVNQRVKEHLARRKAGLKMFRVTLSEFDCIDALVNMGFLDQRDAENDEAVAQALNRMVEFVLKQWENYE